MGVVSGIYRIENLVNGKIYIGSSANISNRWSGHKSHLRKGIHSNSHLQNSWNKYGGNAFSMTIIVVEEDRDEMLTLEQRHLDNLSPEYNIRKKVTDYSDGKGEQVATSKLTESQVLHIRNMSEKGISNAELSRRFPVCPSNIANIVNGKTWKHVGGKIRDEKIGRRVSDKIALEIRMLWVSGRYKYRELSDSFGLSLRTIARIINFESHRDAGGKTLRKLNTISRQDVNKIRDMWNSGGYTQVYISNMFGIHRSTVGNIVNNRGRYEGV